MILEKVLPIDGQSEKNKLKIAAKFWQLRNDTQTLVYLNLSAPSFCLRDSVASATLHLRHSKMRFSGVPSASGLENSESLNGLQIYYTHILEYVNTLWQFLSYFLCG